MAPRSSSATRKPAAKADAAPSNEFPSVFGPFKFLVIMYSLSVVLAYLADRFNLEATLVNLLPFRLPSGNGRLALAGLAFFFSTIVTLWQAAMVGHARRAYGVKYPNVYATKELTKYANEFNCVQRASLHTHEGEAQMLGFLIFASFKVPVTAALCHILFYVSRIFFSLGYYTGDPANRERGAFGYLGLMLNGA